VERVIEAYVGLPRVLLSVRDRLPPTVDGEGVLFHDLGLTDLIRLSAAAGRPAAVDMDTVEGLSPDAAAVTFVAERLGIKTMITRRPAMALHAVKLGCLALLHVHCLDSTGFERALESHPGRPVGTALSPGVVLEHLALDQRARLPEPVLAYGLVRRREDRDAALAAGAAAVMTRFADGESPATAARLRRVGGPG
jgi:glycerol-3-phosphate responsive antiterminator